MSCVSSVLGRTCFVFRVFWEECVLCLGCFGKNVFCVSGVLENEYIASDGFQKIKYWRVSVSQEWCLACID